MFKKLNSNRKIQRYDSMSTADFHSQQSTTSSFSHHQQQQHQQQQRYQQQSSFAQNQESYHRQSTSHTDLNLAGQSASRSVSHLNLNQPPQRLPPPSAVASAGRHASTSGGNSFNVTPEQLVRPPRPRDDMANQSFSFRMLNKWIADSEQAFGAGEHLMRSKKDEEEERERVAQNAQNARKSEGTTDQNTLIL
jgi:hypothetical protein